MQVILLKDVSKVGRKYEVVDVVDGYAANFLIPKRLAEKATPSRIAELAKRKAASLAAEDARHEDVKEKLSTLKERVLTMSVKADEQGHLYKKLHAHDIMTALTDEFDVELDEGSIVLDAPIGTLGEHVIPIETLGIKATLTVSVVGE